MRRDRIEAILALRDLGAEYMENRYLWDLAMAAALKVMNEMSEEEKVEVKERMNMEKA